MTRVEIGGVEYELGDAPENEEIELVPPNKFLFGVHVKHTNELERMGDDIAKFMEKLGGGEMEVHVSVNAKLAEPGVIGFHQEPAIGYMEETEADEWEEEEADDE